MFANECRPAQTPCAELTQSRKSSRLSGREQDVLRLLAVGKCNKEISTILKISVKTVETYRARVMLKTRASSLAHLVHYAIRHGIVEIQE